MAYSELKERDEIITRSNNSENYITFSCREESDVWFSQLIDECIKICQIEQN